MKTKNQIEKRAGHTLTKAGARHRMQLTIKVCERAEREIEALHDGTHRMSLVMDLDSIPELDLDKFLYAPSFDFTHDICGIIRHMDRRTYPGKLMNCFWPRCAAQARPLRCPCPATGRRNEAIKLHTNERLVKMKLSKRAQSAMIGLYDAEQHPVIAALVQFAAQNPGLEFGNYGNSKSYNQESRGIGQDWVRFKQALAEASAEGVTDTNVAEAAPNAFSGRLTWRTLDAEHGKGTNLGHWSYTTGQYWPTEYRKAAATVLEAATRAVRQSRPPEKQAVTSIGQLKALNEKNGGCWFEPATMRFFRTRIESGIIKGKYFITSEAYDDAAPRKYTIRSFDETGDVDTCGDFQKFDTKAEAMAAIKEAQPEAVAA